MKDLHDLFYEMQRTKTVPACINQSLSELLKSGNENIIKAANSFSVQLNFLRTNIQSQPGFCNSAITKLREFVSLSDTFGDAMTPDQLTLDLREMMSDKFLDVTSLQFNLQGYCPEEKTLIYSFLQHAGYVYGSLKDYTNTNNPKHIFITDELQSFLNIKQRGQKTPMIATLEKISNEMRKYGVSSIAAYQFITSELSDLLNNVGFGAIFALPPDQADLFTQNISNGVSGIQTKNGITNKDITNLKRGQFFFLADTNNHGVQTVLANSLNIGDKKTREILYRN